ncbi:hypothetical protein BDZ97DRAFT_1801956 [Flammula alnicola]|nr:hypothetical protein BDZ97DRAFT_1801956 [Flammula alnicola]
MQESNEMIIDFSNDRVYISTKWLLRINGRGLRVEQLLLVKRIGTAAEHYVALLEDNQYVCDCGMGTSLGLPCHHFFQVPSKTPSLHFDIGHVRARWYIPNPSLNITSIAPVSLEHRGNQAMQATNRTRLDIIEPAAPTTSHLTDHEEQIH